MQDEMKRMKPPLLATDLGFLLYWALSLTVLVGIDVIPQS